MSTGHPLGIDVGGSGIKGAPVDLELGDFAQKRRRIDTPEVSTPEAVCDVIAQVVDHFDEVRSDSPIGVTIPGVVQHGVVKTAANIDKSWIAERSRSCSRTGSSTTSSSSTTPTRRGSASSSSAPRRATRVS